ncbi:MAG: clostripain-related cysteine peptidase [Prevotella sp.]|uniref:clostripain-related cysteine peptidase n=1 Tax=Prevotella sp. TaxID=59823 RepID=UPI002A2716BB|nr:clostripain-related cysteine peptidase [Prevotella sp.]MDD7318292.1 clostripain-related cysteine peptidase [Prevotellaceae bacterium]MDY4019704.1 clostripain-related cysteine peptidase [Prevotella sp.]
MKKLILLLITTVLLVSCHDDTTEDRQETQYTQTIFMYLPWSGSNMTTPFRNNIKGLEDAITKMRGTPGRRVVVFMADSEQEASLTEIAYRNGRCIHDTLRKYSFAGNEFTTPAGIANILSDVKVFYDTPHYAMIIGSHGMAWVPKGTVVGNHTDMAKPHYENMVDEWKQTRFFGHSTDKTYQTDISDLSKALTLADIHADYILFDDCYMANIETAYELRNSTDMVIGSPTEIMLYGMPYDIMGKAVVGMDWKAVCSGFLSFYTNYQYPYGTISVIRCAELDNMAAIMRDINAAHSPNEEMLSEIQAYDGLKEHLFFDMHDYVEQLCHDDMSLYSRFTQSLEKLVIAKAATEAFYSVYNRSTTPIYTYSGISISDPSANKAASHKSETSWWRATH